MLTTIRGRCHICNLPHEEVVQVSSYSDSMNVCETCLSQISRLESLRQQSAEIRFQSLHEFCEYLSESDQILCLGTVRHPDQTESFYTIEAKDGQIMVNNDNPEINLVHFDTLYEALDAHREYPIDSHVYVQAFNFLEGEYNKYRSDPKKYDKSQLGCEINDWGIISASDLIQSMSD